MQDWTFDDGGYAFPTDRPSEISANHPLRVLFSTMVERAFLMNLGVFDSAVTTYVADMLTDFSHMRNLYKVRNLSAQPLEEVADMIVEADVRLSATSFNREREVHKHIGDFLLFWSGVFPEFLQVLKAPTSRDAIMNVAEQGRVSYHIASTFEYAPHEKEAETFKKLSAHFVDYQYGLRLVRATFDGFAKGTDWVDGFRA